MDSSVRPFLSRERSKVESSCMTMRNDWAGQTCRSDQCQFATKWIVSRAWRAEARFWLRDPAAAT
jgi:hypothetical protein